MNSRILPNDYCELGNHKIPAFSGYVYHDAANGIPEMIRVCNRCMSLHVLKYYPNCRWAEIARKDPARFDLTPQDFETEGKTFIQGKLL